MCTSWDELELSPGYVQGVALLGQLFSAPSALSSLGTHSLMVRLGLTGWSSLLSSQPCHQGGTAWGVQHPGTSSAMLVRSECLGMV